MLYAPTEEERVLWLNGFSRLLGVPVNDPYFTPLESSSTTSLNLPRADSMNTKSVEEEKSESNLENQVIDISVGNAAVS